MKSYQLRRGEAPDYLDPAIVSAFLQRRNNLGFDGIEALRKDDKFIYALYFRSDPEESSGPIVPVYQLVNSRTVLAWLLQNYGGVVFLEVEGSIARVYAYEPPWLKEDAS